VKTSQIIPVTPGVIHYTPRRRPNIRAALIISGVCLVIAALIILPFIPVTLTFWGSICGQMDCIPTPFYTTRPLWLWLVSGGGR